MGSTDAGAAKPKSVDNFDAIIYNMKSRERKNEKGTA